MKTFLCAVCILLLLIALVLYYTFYTVSLTDRMAEEVAALPRADHDTCLEAATALEAKWRCMRRIVSLSVNIRTVEQIDHLAAALRVTAAEGAVTEFEIHRAHLAEALRGLREMTLCGLWAIL